MGEKKITHFKINEENRCGRLLHFQCDCFVSLHVCLGLHTKGIFKKPKRVNWNRDCFLFKQAFGSLTATIQLLFKTKWKIYKDRLSVQKNAPSNTGRKHSVPMQNMPVA